MTKLSFTLAELGNSDPCLDGVSRLTKSLTGPYDGTTAVNYYDHVESVTTEDLLWALKLTRLSELDQRTICVRVAIYAARSAMHIFEREYPNDQRPRRAIEVAERCVDENFSVESVSNVRIAVAEAVAVGSVWAVVARAAAVAAVEERSMWVAMAKRDAARSADDPIALKADIKNYALELIRSYDHG